jgi:hypothetical protein
LKTPGSKRKTFGPLPNQKLIASIGTGSVAQTIIPAVYVNGNGDVFVDSRGAGELGGHSDEAGCLAASILTEMICRAAKSVRIVVIVTFAAIAQLGTIDPLISQIGSLLKNQNDPILWIVNQRHIGYPGAIPALDPDGFDEIMEEIQDYINQHVSAVQTKFGQKITSTVKAVNCLNNSLCAQPSRITYLDPFSKWSIDYVLNQIRSLSAINIIEMKFGNENQSRTIFDKGFEQLLLDETPLLRNYPVFALYDRSSISQLDPSKIVNEIDMGKQRNESYSILNNEEADLNAKIRTLETEQEIYRIVPFNEQLSIFKWFRIVEVFYPPDCFPVQYIEWKYQCQEGTNLKTINNNGSLNICIIFESDWFNCCVGHVDFYIWKKDRPTTKQIYDQYKDRKEAIIRERNDLKALETANRESKVQVRRKELIQIGKAYDDLISKHQKLCIDGRIEQYCKIIEALWRPGMTKSTKRQAVDDFLNAFELYKSFRMKSDIIQPLPIAKVTELAIQARNWLRIEMDEIS